MTITIWIGILPDPRQAPVPRLKLIVLKLVELYSRNRIWTLWPLDPENQGHDPKTNRLALRPMGKLYTKFQLDSCKFFWVITQKLVSSDRQAGRQAGRQCHNVIHPFYDKAYNQLYAQFKTLGSHNTFLGASQCTVNCCLSKLQGSANC